MIRDKHRVIHRTTWNKLFNENNTEDKDIVFTVTHFSGTSREVADRARTTIGLPEGDKEVSDEYMRKLYLCEHSPIRIQHYMIKVDGIPYSTAMHFVRHHVGTIPFVSTKRDDRIDMDQEDTRDRDSIPVIMEIDCNAQSIIDISKKRLCSAAHIRTIKVWQKVVDLLSYLNEPLASVLVPDCVYRGWCMEHKTCGYHLSDKYQEKLSKYREGVNTPKPKDNELPSLSKGDVVQVRTHMNPLPRTATVIRVYPECIMLDYSKQLLSIPKDSITELNKIGGAYNVGKGRSKKD